MKLLLTIVILQSTFLSASAFDLTILHTNDVHARFEQMDKYGGDCSAEEDAGNECFGGVARRVTKVNEIRSQRDNVLLLDAGDQFQGTMWFYYYKGTATSHFMNLVGYDVMALGNHEFDNNPDGLAPFLKEVNFAVLSSNMDASAEPVLTGLTNKSTILKVGGENIGIIGYTFSGTHLISSAREVRFGDEVEAIQKEVDILQAMQVNKIIAVGHSGISIDQKIAREVDGVDVVVGGHTDTFLYSGTPPSTEEPYGPYPIVIHPDANPERNVLVVQDYTFGKYLGDLQVTFDENGDVTAWQGNPIFLNSSVVQDPNVLNDVNTWSEPVRNVSRQYVGRTNVKLEGDRIYCRQTECNLGNLITDGFVHMNVREPDELRWSLVSMAIWNGGGIRQSIQVGDITIGDVNTVLPFGNTVDIVELKGLHIKEAFEYCVKNYGNGDLGGEFLQVSGIRVKYDMRKESGSRVVEIEVRCSNCTIPHFVPLEPEMVYPVITSSYIADGGDGFEVISQNKISQVSGNLESAMLAEYITLYSPITTGLDNRIIFITEEEDPCVGSSASIPVSAPLVMSLTLLLLSMMFKNVGL
ncbi:snake venom 5'-nucleotidase-like [Anneissia japonica]|uniref:snake venom 5'-nucleotidase-like n=1 Tax=Anneissia japonica TaxID=1529436 RepID=UPI0014257D14|nr:snake venom 5'-nucleotidase-like [Anneissia japonica]